MQPLVKWRTARVLVCVALLAAAAGSGAEPASGPLPVGVARDFPPYLFVDDPGEARGFGVDLFRAVADLQGLTYEFVPGTAEEIARGRLTR
jgi:polar amino acid transport system substrate-binding protein